MARRTSIYVDALGHKNPIPAAARVGNVLVSGIVSGSEPGSSEVPATIERQCELMFAHVRAIVESGGGSTDDIVKMTVYLADAGNRDALNHEWTKMFPDHDNRPARQAMPGTPNAAWLIQCDFMAVVES